MLFAANETIEGKKYSRRLIAKTFDEALAIANQKGWTDVGALVAEYDSNGNLIREYNDE